MARIIPPPNPEAEPAASFAAEFPGKQQKKKPRGKPYAKGESGNPSGPKKGFQHKITKAMQALLLPAAPEILKKLVENAKAGDLESLKLYFKMVPRLPRFAPTPIDLPIVASARDAATQIAEMSARVARGEIDLETYGAAIDGLRAFIMAFGTTELEAELERLRALERGDE